MDSGSNVYFYPLNIKQKCAVENLSLFGLSSFGLPAHSKPNGIAKGFVLALKEPELTKLASNAATLLTDSLKKQDAGGILHGGLVAWSAMYVALQKNPSLLS